MQERTHATIVETRTHTMPKIDQELTKIIPSCQFTIPRITSFANSKLSARKNIQQKETKIYVMIMEMKLPTEVPLYFLS